VKASLDSCTQHELEGIVLRAAAACDDPGPTHFLVTMVPEESNSRRLVYAYEPYHGTVEAVADDAYLQPLLQGLVIVEATLTDLTNGTCPVDAQAWRGIRSGDTRRLWLFPCSPKAWKGRSKLADDVRGHYYGLMSHSRVRATDYAALPRCVQRGHEGAAVTCATRARFGVDHE
jgi:hypothetical protein